MSKKSLEEKLLKPYSDGAIKIRRILFNLYRPIMHDKSESIWNQHALSYLMLVLFIWTSILVGMDSANYYIPFLSGWILIPITWVYFKFCPQTWVEMYDYEKEAFRAIWKLPADWTPIK
tara:strand:- start:7078 stop:7434 length:357 start_codon:yes stop_codon:yes gene_type:complete